MAFLSFASATVSNVARADDAVPYVWVGDTPGPRAERALEEWAKLRSVALAPPQAVPVQPIPVDLAVADAVEAELLHARDAIAALDGDGADKALARAEVELLAHPELPQAAWLLAEVRRASALRTSRIQPFDEARATRDWAARGRPRRRAPLRRG